MKSTRLPCLRQRVRAAAACSRQRYCSSKECQRARRRDWQRNRLGIDSDYRDNQGSLTSASSP